jgi:hypothetical protein
MRRNSHLTIAQQIQELEWLIANDPNKALRDQYRAEHADLTGEPHGRRSLDGSGEGDVGRLGSHS